MALGKRPEGVSGVARLLIFQRPDLVFMPVVLAPEALRKPVMELEHALQRIRFNVVRQGQDQPPLLGFFILCGTAHGVIPS